MRHKMRNKVWMSLVLMCMLLINFGSVSPTLAAARVEETRFTPGELIINLKSSALSGVNLQSLSPTQLGPASLNQLSVQYGVQSVRQVFDGISPQDPVAVEFGLPNTLILTAAPGSDLRAMRDAFRADPNVEFAEFNQTLKTLVMPNDPRFGAQWALHNGADHDIDAPEAWNLEKGRSGVMIAVIDTGVLSTHPDLAGTRVRTDIDRDFINNDDNAVDDNGHGTHVAGIIGASTNNGLGMAGVCGGCSILPVKVLDAQGSGSAEKVAAGIRYAADKGAQILSLSLGMDPNCGCSKTIAQAINYAFNKGSLLVIASGNNGKAAISYPGSSPRALTVGASNSSDQRTSFSNYGNNLDLVAPGKDILSTWLGNAYQTHSGTSMATPHVSGVAGLVLSKRPALTNIQLWWVLQHSSDDLAPAGWDIKTGFGRLNARRALALAQIGQVNVAIDTCNREPQAGCGDCSTEVALSETPSSDQTLTALYAFRDTVLSQSAQGQEWTRLFYRHTLEVSGLLAADPVLRQQAAEVLNKFMPAIQYLTDSSSFKRAIVLNEDQILAAANFKNALLQQASAELASDLEREWAAVSPEQYAGRSVKEVWTLITSP